jgi:tripartite-type tricarboxylate transporter receptor subunit TctC
MMLGSSHANFRMENPAITDRPTESAALPVKEDSTMNVRSNAVLMAAAPLVTACIACMPSRAAQPASPGDYPTKPVRLVTGSPGSTADISARFVGQHLSERWGQQVLVDNRGGAGGIIGAEIAARSAPDGYTYFNGHIGTHASPQFLFRKLSYDPVKDFIPVTQLTNSGIALVVNAALPARDLKEFVALARTRPGGINYGSAGGGTSSQLSGELFTQMTGAKLVHVPYKGAGFALTGVAAGEVQAAFLSTTTASVQVKAGKLRALAVMSNERFPASPEIPTAAEQGFPGVDSSVWFGLFAPAGTPRARVQKTSRDVGDILRLPEARNLLLAQGADPSPSTPEEFEKFLKSEIVKWGKVIKAAGIEPL